MLTTFVPAGLVAFRVGAARESGVVGRQTANPIVLENRHKGTASWLLKVLTYHREIEGYASANSVAAGQTISFSVSTTGSSFRADVYRMGWYHGAGARLMRSITGIRGHLRSMPKPARGTGLIVCHWPVSFSLSIPKTWISGVYLVKLTASNTHQGYIPFVVTDLSSHSALLFIHGVFTDEAYNSWGGKSLYVDIHYKTPAAQLAHRAHMVSFQRPFEQNMGAGWFLSWEVHMDRWLESRGYDVTYATDQDVAEHPGILLHHKAILIVGHDEYWTLSMRNGMDRAVDHGVNLADFAANTGFWQIRLANLGRVKDRIIVCYKSATLDPLNGHDNAVVTTQWRAVPVDRPESELTGAMYGTYEGAYGPYRWVVSNPRIWIFRGTGLRKGQGIPEVVGPEADQVYHDFPLPHGLHIVATSSIRDSTGASQIQNATIYRARSGAYVFDAATIEWSWGLDDIREVYWLYPAKPSHPNRDAQIITANILKRFTGGKK